MTTSTADRSRDLPFDAATRMFVDPVDAIPGPRPDDRQVLGDEYDPANAARLSRAQYDAVAATVSRRRSLTDSLQVAFTAYWDTVIIDRDAHLAVRTGGIQTPSDAPRVVSSWLALIVEVHQMRWELPDDQIALFVSATLEGLTVDYLASGRPDPARAVLQVLAYQVGRYGRRPAKNQQH